MAIPKKNPDQREKLDEKLICSRCKCPLEFIELRITYLDRHFTHKVPRCPQCGQVFVPQDLAEGKMAQVEKSLEEK
ncbi:MAG: DNA-binding protein [Clostridiales bacterium]|nr:DNA-binding protein [Clostridiales bacterium]